jgi:hypothetical protein
MGWACSAYGARRGVYKVSVGKSEGKRPLGRPRRLKSASCSLSQASKFVRKMQQVTSSCWTPKTRGFRSTIFDIRKQRTFEESSESKPDPNDSTVAFSKLTERLGLTEAGIRVFEDNDSNKQRAVTTTQGVYEDACLLWWDSEREGKLFALADFRLHFVKSLSGFVHRQL